MPAYRHSDLPVTETLRDLLAALPLWQEEGQDQDLARLFFGRGCRSSSPPRRRPT